MLRISVSEMQENVVLDVEGRLAGPWVSELEGSWHGEQARSNGRGILVRLRAVTFIDDAGKELLSRMFEHNVKLEGSGCLVQAILAGITGEGSRQHRNSHAVGGTT